MQKWKTLVERCVAPSRAILLWFATLIVLMLPIAAIAAVPTFTPFEGVLTSAGGGPVSDGPYALTFAVYEAAAGGVAVWVEGPVEVTCTGGRFVYLLGSTAPLDTKQFAGLKTAFLGVKVGNDPEFPRQPLGSVAYALHAGSADTVACSSCVGATSVGFNYAGSATKGGAAADLSCTGCVSVAEIKFDGDVDLAGQSIKAGSGTFSGDVVAKSVTAIAFIGDGSKLTGLKSASGSCSKAGDVVKGIKADGSLDCVSFSGSLPPDGLSAVSNGVLSNVFVDVLPMPVKGIAIPDNTGAAATSNIDVPDLGTVRDISVTVALTNTDLSKVSIQLLPPDDKAIGMVLCDPCGEADAKTLTGKWTTKVAPQSGDLAPWIGQNAKGLWTLKVLDSGFCVPQKPGNKDLCLVAEKTDGAVADWSVQIETLSNSKIHNPIGHLMGRVVSAAQPDLADGKTLEIDTKSGSPAVIAQAWIYDKEEKTWLQASTSVDSVSGCASCGTGKDGDYKPGSSTNLVGKTWEFKDFIIAKGVTIKVTGNTPLIIRASGSVVIDGILDLSGTDAADSSPGTNGCSQSACSKAGVGVAGGATGGYGCYSGAGTLNGTAGGGSGGGGGAVYCSSYGAGGGGGGYGKNGIAGVAGSSGCTVGSAGKTYTGVHAGVLVGGSGGGAGSYGTAYNAGGAGGGGGGGAVRIDAPSIVIKGTLNANGGRGGKQINNCDGGGGGGGSGGGIWLRAAKVELAGASVSAVGGIGGETVASQSSDGGDGGAGGEGQVRIDSGSAAVGTTQPAYTAGDASDLGTLFNRFKINQSAPGKVVLTNTSGQTHSVYLVVTY